jgi:hypothetical protein
MAKKKAISYHMRILHLLSDGAYHTLEEIAPIVSKYVDAEASDAEYRKTHPGWKKVKLATRVAQGKRRLIFLSLNSAIHHRHIVEAGSGRAMDRKYRLTRAALKARNGKSERPAKPISKKAKARKKAAKPVTSKAATLPSNEASAAFSQEVKA